MTKYSLEEFKQWLEEKEERKEELNWDALISVNKITTDIHLEKLIQGKDYLVCDFSVGRLWDHPRRVIQKWLTERERERERANEEEPTNMVNAQDWLNKKFLTQESREKVKEFGFYGNPGSQGDVTTIRNEGEICWLNGAQIAGELDLGRFINVERLHFHRIKDSGAVIGLEKLTKLYSISLDDCPHLRLSTSLDAWKAKIEQLKTQLAEYEQAETMPGSWTETTSDPSEPLNTKIQRKKQELVHLRTGSKKSTAPLRKEIELLEKIQTLENKVSEQETKETNYQQQIHQKEEQITAKQTEINRLTEAKTQAETNLNHTITDLNQQITQLKKTSQENKDKLSQELTNLHQNSEQTITNLRQEITQLTNTSKREKEALQKQVNQLQKDLKTRTEAEKQLQEQKTQLEQQLEKLEKEKKELGEQMVKERQEALQEWEKEKQNLTKNIQELGQEKDKFKQSADYLRDTLKTTEKDLESTKNQLTNTENQASQAATDHQSILNQKDQELTKKQESYKLI